MTGRHSGCYLAAPKTNNISNDHWENLNDWCKTGNHCFMMFHVLGFAVAIVCGSEGSPHSNYICKFCGHARKSQHITDTWFWVSVLAWVQLLKSLRITTQRLCRLKPPLNSASATQPLPIYNHCVKCIKERLLDELNLFWWSSTVVSVSGIDIP